MFNNFIKNKLGLDVAKELSAEKRRTTKEKYDEYHTDAEYSTLEMRGQRVRHFGHN